MIARIEPLTTTRRLSGPFDYLAEDVAVGSIVKMPFGHQKLEGVVVGLAETSDVPAEKLVAITSVREDSIPRDLVDLALWMAEEYCSTPARALALVTPPPGKPKTMFWAAPTGAEGRVNDNQRALLERLPGPAGGDLAALRRLEKRGLVAISDARGPSRARARTRPRTASWSRRPPRPRRWRRSRPPPARRTCCTASPARARPRSTCAPPPRRWSGGRA